MKIALGSFWNSYKQACLYQQEKQQYFQIGILYHWYLQTGILKLSRYFVNLFLAIWSRTTFYPSNSHHTVTTDSESRPTHHLEGLKRLFKISNSVQWKIKTNREIFAKRHFDAWIFAKRHKWQKVKNACLQRFSFFGSPEHLLRGQTCRS